jgi:drug/metabolite transporter (DMT)-like permease
VKSTRLALISLLIVAAAWGGAFVWMKDAIERQPFFDFLAVRFTIATLLMIAIRPKLFKQLDAKFTLQGLGLGVVLGLGYVTQTIGLELGTAAITGFFTGLYVVLTPIFAWMLLRQRITSKVLLGVILATIGLGLITISGFGFNIGAISLLACAVLFALHIVGLSVVSPGRDTYALTVLQLGAVAVVCWIGALPDGYQSPPDADVWAAVLFCAVFATAIAFLVQTWAQSLMDASRVAIVLTTEVVFAALFAVLAGQEVLSWQTIVGGTLMVIAMLIVEWPSRRRPHEPEPIVPLEPLVH